MTGAERVPDPQTQFGTEEARRRVLAAWADSADRFREDANSEEDLVLGGYRDRVMVELAQNAADAAQRAGIAGRLLLRLTGDGPFGTLIAANTGAPLDLAGVRALASLRASAKRDGEAVGRFGVGFAAVLAVTDCPAVRSTTGGIRFSADQTRRLVSDAGGDLAAELDRRNGHVPILRLPFPESGLPPEGFDTAVVLELRDEAARELVLRLLAEVNDALLLALPALAIITIEQPGREPRTITDAGTRWHVLRRSGQLDPALADGGPVESRARASWQVTWAVPLDLRTGLDGVPPVVHAPTPSDEPSTLPALLIASLPLDASRRHVAASALTTQIVQHAADAYAELVRQRAEDGDEAWQLVPAGLPAGPLDHALRSQIMARLRGTPMLAAADHPELLLRPRDALAMTPPLGADQRAVAELATWMAGLVQAPRAADAALAALGVRRLELAEVIEQLPQTRDPARWRGLYDALDPYAADPRQREALAAIGVPLADGRVARGPRGLLMGTEGVPAQALSLLGVKVVDPDAAHRLLERLGATPAGPRAVLELGAVRTAVLSQPDSENPGEIADAVLNLIRAAVTAGQLAPGDLPWLGELELDDAEGELAPAVALAVPGSPAARWFDPGDVGLVSAQLVNRWGSETLAAAGVLNGPGLWHAYDVGLGDELDDELDEPDGWAEWSAQARELVAAQADSLGAVITELSAVRDLDLVRPAALPDVVTAIAGDPALRQTLLRPWQILAGGEVIDVAGHTAWWLRRRLTGGAAAGAEAEAGMAALLPPAPDWLSGLDAAVQKALGIVLDPADLDAAALPVVLDRLADPAAVVAPGFLLRLMRYVGELAAGGAQLSRPPDLVRALSPSGTVVVPASRACIVDAPMYRQRPDLGAPVLVPAELGHALADLLDLPLARELAAGQVDEAGAAPQPVDPAAHELLGGAVASWCEHDELLVDGVQVDWWVDDAGLAHAATLYGLARALAFAAGQWGLRHALDAVLLAEPADRDHIVAEALAEEAFSAGGGRRSG